MKYLIRILVGQLAVLLVLMPVILRQTPIVIFMSGFAACGLLCVTCLKIFECMDAAEAQAKSKDQEFDQK